MFKNLFVGVLLAVAATAGCKKDEATKASSIASTAAPLSVKRGLLIARGLGGIDGLQLTNSIEALRCNHRRGFRWFELDLAATADGELVGFHKGDEKSARLSDQVWKLPISAVEGKKYGDRFPIARFSTLLAEADRLGDVVLVIDTDGWTANMDQAISRTLGYGPAHPTRIVLQVYEEKQLASITTLSKELGASLMLNLRRTDANDVKVEELVKKHPFLAVVAPASRFTPWLAERLHAAQTPILVQTVNEHRDIVGLTRAGADGFYTDRYVPYDTIAADPATAMDCGETKPSRAQLQVWNERDVMERRDYRLQACAKRKSNRIELANCEPRPALRGNPLAVPAAETLHVETGSRSGRCGSQPLVGPGAGEAAESRETTRDHQLEAQRAPRVPLRCGASAGEPRRGDPPRSGIQRGSSDHSWAPSLPR